MGLEQVVTQVKQDGQAQAASIVEHANKEAEGILGAAREKVAALEKQRIGEAEREAAQIVTQSASRAKSASRKVVLEAQAGLHAQLREAIIASLIKLPAKQRSAHLDILVKRASGIIPKGRIWGAAADKEALAAQTTYDYAGEMDIAGGIIVESADRTNRLDLSYDTLLSQQWRDVLKAEAALFE